MIDRFLTPRLAASGVTLVFAVLFTVTLVILASAMSGHVPGRELLASLTPLPFYLFALWTARGTIYRISSGEALRTLISPMLGRIGLALFLGGLTQVFLVPWIGPGRSVAHYDIGAITVGAIGVTLVIVARLVRDAERDRAELDEIF